MNICWSLNPGLNTILEKEDSWILKSKHVSVGWWRIRRDLHAFHLKDDILCHFGCTEILKSDCQGE